jgi:uncharacterized protein YcbX
LYRYPVKGLTPEALDRVRLTAGETLPFDRAYAIENGPSGFNPEAPRHFPKIAFLMLMRNGRLAALKTRFEDATRTLTVRHEGKVVAEGSLATEDGRRAIEDFFAVYCADELRGPPRVVHAEGFSLSDNPEKVVSLINLASLRAVEGAVGRPLDPLRFRGNLFVEGMEAWQELGLVGRTIRVGGVTLTGTMAIPRCAATNVDPETGVRDTHIPETLVHEWGQGDCGTYFRVVEGGTIAAGDSVEIV